MSAMKSINYCRLIVILCRCGKEIAKAFLLKTVKDSSPKDHEPFPWTVDHFLFHKKEQIRKYNLGRLIEHKLFPGYAQQTRLDEWDISMFCFILLDICQVEDDYVKQDVRCLRDLRNKIYHKGEPDITDEQYGIYLDRIKGVIDRCTKKIGDAQLQEEMYKHIDQAETINMAEVQESEEVLERWYRSDNYQVQISVEKTSVDPCDLKLTMEQYQMKFEENNKSTSINLSFTFGIRVGGGNRTAEEAFRSVQDAGYNLTLNIKRIKEDLRSAGIDLESQTPGSIVFKSTCSSMTSLMYLLDYLTSPVLGRRLQSMTEAMEDIVDQCVDLEVFIPQEIREEIISKLEEQLTLEPQRKRRKVLSKVFSDPIYGQIELHPLCVNVVDTLQFQRLRYIKQLDMCYLVYPGAMHSRFEHSIGVCHLAGKLLRALKERQPDLDITAKDILCVEIAALCHDLGQGPFSHVFEEKFLPAVNPFIKWKHADASVKMFDYMLRDNGGRLYQDFRRLMPSFEDGDITFIKEMIGVPRHIKPGAWPYEGRNKNKSFLYEIVANGENGIDVDKWDYLARDSHMLGMKTNFDHERCILSARVIMTDGRKQICYREKSSQDLYDMFYTRMTLHRRAYQHKTHNIVGIMIRDVFLAADDHLFFVGENGTRLRLSETINDMKAYTYVTDDILQEIMRSTDKDLQPARDIISRIHNRQFYKCITQTQVDVKRKGWIKKIEVQENLINKILQRNPDLEDPEEVIEIDIVSVDFGRKDEDPVSKVWFYKKWDENRAIRISKDQVSYVLPETFAEQYVRVYSSVTDTELHDAIEKSFSEWCLENDLPQPKGYLSPTARVSNDSANKENA